MTESIEVPDTSAIKPVTRSSAVSVILSLRTVCSLIQLYTDEVGHELGLHRSDITAMNLVLQATRRGESMTPSQIAKRMSLSAAAVTALVDRLERIGHLTRKPDLRDRRRVLLDVSKQAEEVSRDMFAPMNDRLKLAMQNYTDAELAIAARLLRDVTQAVERAPTCGLAMAPRQSGRVRPPRRRLGSASRRSRPTLGDHGSG